MPRPLLALFPSLLFLGAPLFAQLNYSSGSLSESFDSLAGPANNTTGHGWTDNTNLPGWYASRPSYTVTDGAYGGSADAFLLPTSTATAGLFSFGNAAAADRAVGMRSTSSLSGHDPILLGVRLINTAQIAYAHFTLSYVGEQWFRSDSTTAHSLIVEYKLGATALNDATGWTELTGARFNSPQTGTTPAALDGYAAANRASLSASATGLSWAPGQALWVRFRDSNESGMEHGLAVDDFTFAAGGAAPLAPPTLAIGPWSGNVTPVSATVSAAVSRAGVIVRAVASLSPDFSSPILSAPVESVAASAHAVRLDLAGLAPDTDYHYALSLDGVVQTAPTQVGRFRTFPVHGPASFRFGMGACGHWSFENQYVYEALAAEPIRLFLHTGDFNYLDTNSTDPASYRSNYLNALSVGSQGSLLRRHAMAYTWDDHDYSGDNSDRHSAGRMAHRQVYRELVPHYPLPALPGPGETYGGIQQSFQLGRARFIVSDLRSDRDSTGKTDDAAKTMMGAAQKAWFKQQLIEARDSETPIIFWVSAVPFISLETGGDNWGVYRTERAELLAFIRDQRIQNIIILSGDMHALAADDGRATATYVTDGPRIPVFHAASFNRSGSVKGGPYSLGVSPGISRYAVVAVTDDGVAPPTVVYQGKIASSATTTSVWASLTHVTEPVRPLAPPDLTATATIQGVRLAWTDRSGVETGYRIERAASTAGPWTTLVEVAANSTGHHDLDARPATDYAYRLVALNGPITAAPTEPVAVRSLGNLQRWKLEFLGDSEASDSDDRDGDGRTAVLEYALGGDPATADQAPGHAVATVEADGAPRLELSFTRYPARAELRYIVQAGSDLTEWTDIARSENGAALSGAAAITGDGPGEEPRVVQIRDTVPVSAADPRRFLRVRAER